jgi:adenosine deaminase
LTDQLLDTIRAMPKIELHRHMEGALRLETLVDIARENSIEMPEYDVETLRPFVQMMPYEPRGWQNFLAKFKVLRQFFLSPAVIRRITRETIIDAAEDNIKYFELRFTPRALSVANKYSLHQVVTWVCDTTAQVMAEYDIEVKLIVSMNRHESLAIAEESLEAAIAHKHLGVVGVDLAGMEPNNPAYPFRHVFKKAREAGLGITIHAGEWEGPHSIWDAISSIQVDRIGHGIRVLEDYSLVNVLLERNIMLEVCPTSNVASGVSPNYFMHPLPRLIANGVRTTINTDDPLVCNITLSEEMHCSVTQMPLTMDDLKRQTMIAAESAFLPPEEKAALVEKYRDWLEV